MIKTATCRNCGRTVAIPAPSEGHPYGWYSLSVGVPAELGHSGKTYRWVGMFCSVGCLMAHENKLLEYVEATEGLYVRE